MSTITTARSTLGFQIKLTGLSKTFNVDSVVNIYRRQENILYKLRSTPEAANIAHYTSSPLLSNKALHISDRSAILPANRITGLLEPIQLSGSDHYQVPTDKFIVTDVYTADDITKEPLFYKHTISDQNVPRNSDGSVNSLYKITDISIIDVNLDPVNIESLKIDYDKGIIYNNLESSFDRDTGNTIAYYVSYAVKDYNNLVTQFIELISNDKVYREAIFDDLDSYLHIINDGRKVYLVQEQETNLGVTLPISGTYSFQLLEDARLKIIPPPSDSDATDSWNVSITNGKFFNVLDGTIYKYSIPEFSNQNWDPLYPNKSVRLESAAFVSEKLLKVRNENLNTDTTASGLVEVFIYDENNEPLAAYTNNSGIVGNISYNSKAFEMWDRTDKTGIRSIDKITGLIDIDGLALKSSYKYLVNYFYNENAYQFTNVEFNPIYNPTMLNSTVAIFVDPDFNSSVKSKSLYFAIFNKSGKIIKSNLSNFNNALQTITADDGFEHQLFYESYPDYLTQSGNNPTISGAMLLLNNYTVIGSGILLPLGEVSVSDYTHPDSATSIDIRVRGGGLIKDQVDSAKAQQSEVDWFFDKGTWDGMPFPGTASYYIEVPATVLEACGGTMKTDQVRNIVERHTAAGVYPIIKAYGIDPTISGVSCNDSSISIGWKSFKE